MPNMSYFSIPPDFFLHIILAHINLGLICPKNCVGACFLSKFNVDVLFLNVFCGVHFVVSSLKCRRLLFESALELDILKLEPRNEFCDHPL